MQKKILAVLLMLTMLLTFAACGGSGSDTNDGGNNDLSQVDTDNKTDASSKIKRDKTFELSDGTTTCVLAYDSSVQHDYQYTGVAENAEATVQSDYGWTVLTLKSGCTSVEDYIEQYKSELTKGNNSYYMVRDIVITEIESCKVEDRTYKMYQYTYVEDYVSQGSTFDKNGIFAYVQASDNAGILMESCSPTSDGETSGFQRFMESSVYISEVK